MHRFAPPYIGAAYYPESLPREQIDADLDLLIATATMSKLSKGEEVALSVLLRICEYLDADIGDICSVIKQKKEDTV